MVLRSSVTGSSSTSDVVDEGVVRTGEPTSDFTRVTRTTGGLIFLRFGGSGVIDEGGSKASSSEETEGEESDVGDCFPSRRLRRSMDLTGSLRGFLGRGLLGDVGVARVEDELLPGGGPLDDC